MNTVTFNTNKKREVLDITPEANDFINDKKSDGIFYAYLKHTTAALTVADMDPGAEEDYMMAFDDLIPDLDYKHPHNPEHMPDHILSAIIGPYLYVPAKNGVLELGTWQKVVLLEFDGPRERSVVFSYTKEEGT